MITALFWIVLTLAVYGAAVRLQALAGGTPLLNPVLIACLGVGAAVALSGTEPARYLAALAPVTFLLAPATVALALPIFRERARLRASLLPLAGALAAGSLTAILTALAVFRLMGPDPVIEASLAPKSATTPIAIAVAEGLGGLASLTAAIVIATGILGAIVSEPLFRLLRVRDLRARGFALGLAAHGIGTAAAFRVSPQLGAYAGLGLGLNGVLTAVLAPLVLTVWP